MKIVVIGANGMLGSIMFRVMSENTNWQVYGTVRDPSKIPLVNDRIRENIIAGINIEQIDQLAGVLELHRPEVVINCVGIIKQKESANDPLVTLPINSIFPHRLARFCKLINARLIHISTDCVFSGLRGSYTESDLVDARDLYGISKAIGEVDYYNTITLRTSIIGHESQSANGLLEWFLSQETQCKGYRSSIFSGLPTVTLSKLIRDYIIPNREISGLYHVGSDSISKFDLLKTISEVYKKKINIVPDDKLVINRSLNSKRFQQATGFSCPKWIDLINEMYQFQTV
jgi:dTDP-4-dehydrorhamnose reductase